MYSIPNPELLDVRRDVKVPTPERGKEGAPKYLGTKVSFRLVEDEDEDMGVPKRQNVRDGVVQESALREWYKDWNWSWFNIDEKIAEFKRQVEWRELDSWCFNGFKYFILSKKLPRLNARRYLRQELERLKNGTAAFFKEGGRETRIRAG